MANRVFGDEEFQLVIGAARDGRAWAFEHLFHLVAQPLVGFFRAQGSVDPDGLANETLLRVFKDIAAFDGDADGFRAWTFSIARCRLIDERRALARRPRCEPLLDALAEGESCSGDPETSAENDALDALGAVWVQETLDALSLDQRDVLVLRIVADLDVEQVAEVLGKTPGAVKALQHRGIAAIRRTFSAQTVSF